MDILDETSPAVSLILQSLADDELSEIKPDTDAIDGHSGKSRLCSAEISGGCKVGAQVSFDHHRIRIRYIME
jgi:hypothetical protein